MLLMTHFEMTDRRRRRRRRRRPKVVPRAAADFVRQLKMALPINNAAPQRPDGLLPK